MRIIPRSFWELFLLRAGIRDGGADGGRDAFSRADVHSSHLLFEVDGVLDAALRRPRYYLTESVYHVL